jgi:AcrR family transcriptional regulator
LAARQGRYLAVRAPDERQLTRRTQSERRAETRGRLLDATIESLIEVGYAGTTIRAVTERAGVSQGAQSHHFPHRVDLVASAFEHLAEQRSARYAERARALSGDRTTRLRALLDMLWEDFSSPLFTVAAKLWVAAADDEELRERLIPVERRIYAGTAEVAREVAGELGAEPGFERKLAVAMNTVAGLALVREFDPSGRASRGNQWPYHREALERMLEA